MKPEHDSEWKALLHSFGYAFEGWWHALCHERNVWVHLVLTMVVVVAGSWLDVSRMDWAVLVLAIGLVWMAELMNTAIETLVDLVSPDFHLQAKIVKDTAAAGVLVSAITAFVVGLLVLGPPIWEALRKSI